MRIFKVRAFDRWASKEGLTDDMLRTVVREMERGLTGDNLGGNVYKKRVALGSRGKRAGARTLLVYRVADTAFFVKGFAKRDIPNIGDKELGGLKRLASNLLSHNKQALNALVKIGELSEVSESERVDS